MARPEIRAKHLTAMQGQPINFRGGNGQRRTTVQQIAALILEPLGFMAEYAIPTKGHGTPENPPRSYKADFANPQTREVIELDGPSHRPMTRKAQDMKKDLVLKALGWRVARVIHT
jgi:hypothetical protein